MNNLDNIGQTFQWAGQRYMAIMQPFAEKIFLGLVLIEIIITCCTSSPTKMSPPAFSPS